MGRHDKKLKWSLQHLRKDTGELTKQCPGRRALDLTYYWTAPDTVIRSLLLL